jgi:hypothetical protein
MKNLFENISNWKNLNERITAPNAGAARPSLKIKSYAWTDLANGGSAQKITELLKAKKAGDKAARKGAVIGGGAVLGTAAASYGIWSI